MQENGSATSPNVKEVDSAFGTPVRVETIKLQHDRRIVRARKRDDGETPRHWRVDISTRRGAV